jgi:hypothetical protein
MKRGGLHASRISLAMFNCGQHKLCFNPKIADEAKRIGGIIAFHRSRGIPPRFGRTIWRNKQHYYRWCFSDLATARAFVEQFGGAFYKTTGA